MTNRYELVVDGYVQLAGYLMEQWGQRYTNIAAQIDQGALNSETLMATASDCVGFAVQSVALLLNETLDAAAVMSGTQDEPHIVTSATFETSATGDAAAGRRTLRVAAPMIADLGHDSLPLAAITVQPDTLEPGATTFELAVDASGHPALGYSGVVHVHDEAGQQIEAIDVWVTT
jgi:hypothetical protein